MLLSPANPLPVWALSGGPLIWRRLQADSPELLGTQIVGALLSALWVQTGVLVDGVTLQATSPQTALGLTVQVDVTWGGDTNVGVQFHGTAVGFQHILGCAAGRQFQIVAGPCQFFISVPTDPGEAYGSAVSGGIPYISPGCGIDGPAPDEVWWSAGDWNGGFFNIEDNPRNAIGFQSNPTAWCGYFHVPGESLLNCLVEHNPGSGGASFDLMIGELALAGTFTWGTPTLTMRYWNLEPIAYEPFLFWGDYYTSTSPYPQSDFPPKFRGQLWDAVIESGGQDYEQFAYVPALSGTAPDIEGIMYLDGSPHGMRWINYSMGLGDGLMNGSLYLLLPGLGQGNVAAIGATGGTGAPGAAMVDPIPAPPMVYYAATRVHSKSPFPMETNSTTVAAMEMLANTGGLLAQAGWTINPPGSSYCTADIFVPFGFGLSASFCLVDGVVYQIVAGGGPPLEDGPGGPVAVGQILNLDSTVNQAATAANLALAITTYSQFNAVAVPDGLYWNIVMTAKVPGPVANWSDIEASPGNLATNNQNGAWQWLSAPNSVGSQIGVTLSTEGYGSANLHVQQQYIGSAALLPVGYTPPPYSSGYYLAQRAQWQFWADQYSLAFWVSPAEDEGGHAGDGSGGNNFYYAGVPQQCAVEYDTLPSEGISSAFAYWGNRATFNEPGNGASLFNGQFVTANIGGAGFSIVAPSTYAGSPLCGKAGGPLITEARVGLPYSTGEMKLVGFLYDAMVVCDGYGLSATSPDGTYVEYAGHIWVALIAQGGATLFLVWD